MQQEASGREWRLRRKSGDGGEVQGSEAPLAISEARTGKDPRASSLRASRTNCVALRRLQQTPPPGEPKRLSRLRTPESPGRPRSAKPPASARGRRTPS